MQKSLQDQRSEALAKAREIAESAKGRAFTDEERTNADALLDSVKSLDEQIEAVKGDEDRMSRLGALAPEAKDGISGASISAVDRPARTLGEHYAKTVGETGIRLLKSIPHHTADAGEFLAKAATDPNTVGTSFGAVLTDVDRTIVSPFRRPVVSDLLGSGSISGTAVTYYVEGAVEGAFATVAEGGQKPQLHFINPDPVTDKVTKIAGWWDNSDEMVEDLPFMVSEINERGRYLLELAEENQLLNGPGGGSNLTGLLNREGIQEIARTGTSASPEAVQDAIFRGMMAVQTATGLVADGIVINPADYQTLRLSKDNNGQYYGGGFFQGQYASGGIEWQPPLWGLRTVVSAAAPAGTVVLGAFKAASTVYRKGGIRVASTNSDLGKFTKNIVTTRIEERLALAVRIPSAVVVVDLANPT